MVSFSRTHYRISLRRFFARGAYRQEGPTGQWGLLASGGGFGPVASPLATPLVRGDLPDRELCRTFQAYDRHTMIIILFEQVHLFSLCGYVKYHNSDKLGPTWPTIQSPEDS